MFFIGARNDAHSVPALRESLSRNFTFALTHHASARCPILYILLARKSFSVSMRMIASSHSYAISRMSSSERVPLRSISCLIAVLSHENEKSRESFSSNTTGKSHRYVLLYSPASLAIFAPPGNPRPRSFATLSNASHAASSSV